MINQLLGKKLLCQENYTFSDNLLSQIAEYNISTKGGATMLCERIRELREKAGYSQTQLAKKLDVTRSSVNAWEMGLSAPTTQYIIALTKLFHVSADYILGTQSDVSLSLNGYSEEEIALVYNLLKYFDSRHQ